ncbi:MAG: FHA domain-containing protein [Anaerolineae bacterium]|nr:FHA domain-containing protein [Anaerolineae bacterium]
MESQRQHTLVVTDGANVGKVYPLQGMICTMGRSADNTVVFDSSRVSRHHVQIRLLPTGTMIEDLGSTNGTWVNGRRLAEPRTLSQGDQIRIADYITLDYAIEEAGSAATVISDRPRGATQVMQGTPRYEPPTPPPPPQDRDFAAYNAASAAQPLGSAGPEVDYVAPAEVVPLETPEPSKRPGWLYIVIGILVILICLCVALAVYLWFAPVAFWERAFDLLGIPMPTGMLVAVALSVVPGI